MPRTLWKSMETHWKSWKWTEKEVAVIGGGVDDFIYGYVNGILDANITKEMKQCDYWKTNAENKFNKVSLSFVEILQKFK